MRTRLLGLALAAGAAVALLPGSANAAGQCGGTYDTNCYTWVCTRNCLEVQCAVWTDVVPGVQQGCFG